MAAGLTTTVVLVWLSLAEVFSAPKSTGVLITPCSLKDPALEACMLSQAKTILPQISAGVREWGLLPLDPLFVTKIELHNSGNEAVNLELAGFNYTFIGLQDTVIEGLRFNPKTLHLEVELLIPKFSGSGLYKVNGQILLLPISGEGPSEFRHDNHRAQLAMDFERVTKGGKEYLKLAKASYNVKTVAKVWTHLKNLFGNKQLSDNMNAVMNENDQALLGELRKPINSAFSELFTATFAPMFERIPLSKLFKNTD